MPRRRLAKASAATTGALSLVAAAALGSPALAVAPPVAGAGVLTTSAAAAPLVTRTSYEKFVSKPFADTFADPSVIRAKDGYWYSYGTSDPLRAGQAVHRIPIARSRDLVSWRHVGDAFSAATLPSWATKDAGLWGPDIRYVNGQYRMYYVVTSTTITGEDNDNAIGMATAPTPVGPWKDSGHAVVGPRRGPSGNPGDFLWTFDPSVVTNTDGSQWMFYGSYYGGVYVQQLDASGRTPVGKATMVGIDNKFEGAYAVHRGGYWYLFASTANCCGGPTTGYSVQVGRSPSITGPYVDRQGVALTASRAGGTPTLNQNGNRWIGAGHNAIATDLSGQDWIVYHAIDRAKPYLVGTDGINRRPMLIDRLDWVNGWPAVRAGRGPSSGRQAGPASGGRWSTDFQGGIPARWRTSGGWRAEQTSQTRSFEVSREPSTLLTGAARLGSARVEADLRSRNAAAYGLRARVGTTGVRVVIDPAGHAVRLQQHRGGQLLAQHTVPLPNFQPRQWHAVSLEIRDGQATATVSHARLGDPLAVVALTLRAGGEVRHAGVLARGKGVGVDNLSVLPAHRPVRQLVADDVPNRLVSSSSDEFNGAGLAPGWSWVRPDAGATVGSGVLRWPVEAADLVGNGSVDPKTHVQAGNNAGVLLRDAPAGAWTIQTKVSINLGETAVHNFQQAGLVAYVNDDLFTRFDHVSIWNTRQTEFGLEMPYAGRLSYGGTIVGPPTETTYLRLTHHIDPANGEHELRAWSRRPGQAWVKGGVWTLPKGAKIRVGLVSHGRASDDPTVATARFDYFRVYH